MNITTVEGRHIFHYDYSLIPKYVVISIGQVFFFDQLAASMSAAIDTLCADSRLQAYCCCVRLSWRRASAGYSLCLAA